MNLYWYHQSTSCFPESKSVFLKILDSLLNTFPSLCGALYIPKTIQFFLFLLIISIDKVSMKSLILLTSRYSLQFTELWTNKATQPPLSCKVKWRIYSLEFDKENFFLFSSFNWVSLRTIIWKELVRPFKKSLNFSKLLF